MKKRWTNQKLFNQIVENLREDGKLPDILEYSEPTLVEKEINPYDLDCHGTLSFGGNEGIYVDVYLAGYPKNFKLGTFKTLRDDKESWDIMAQLMADFQWECGRFINEHYGEFAEGDE